MDIMKIIRNVIWKFVIMGLERRARATRLMWIPGISPVKVPASVPSRSAIIRLNINI